MVIDWVLYLINDCTWFFFVNTFKRNNEFNWTISLLDWITDSPFKCATNKQISNYHNDSAWKKVLGKFTHIQWIKLNGNKAMETDPFQSQLINVYSLSEDVGFWNYLKSFYASYYYGILNKLKFRSLHEEIEMN